MHWSYQSLLSVVFRSAPVFLACWNYLLELSLILAPRFKFYINFQTGQFVAGPRLRALDSPRTNCVTSLFTFYLRLGLLRRFWRRADRILKCNKCSLEYLQHFCHVLRFAPTLTFTLWFVHQTFEVVKSVPVISINKICKKILRIQIKALSCLGNPHLAF